MFTGHRIKRKHSDWETIPETSRSNWQRLAAATGGFITPGNAVSVLGFLLGVWGLTAIARGSLVLGLVTLSVGRLFDIADGLIADSTGTKSRVGEAVDAGLDKLIALLAFIVLFAKDVVPRPVLVIILVFNVLIMLAVVGAKLRHRRPQPSVAGKLAAMAQWLVILLLLAAHLLAPHSVFLSDLITGAAMVLQAVFIVLVGLALAGYTAYALGAEATESYTARRNQLLAWGKRLVRGYLHKKWLVGLSIFTVVVFMLGVYLLATSPYSSDTIVQTPFTTSYENGEVTLTQHYTPHFYSGGVARFVGIYFKQLLTDVWARFSSQKVPGNSADAIVANIHAERFDPSKPYLISGDQFDGLYLRNLSVFYQELLNKNTPLSATDWHDRQRIAVQSLAYALAATQQLKRPVTTLMPISPRGVLALNIYDYPSDSMFSLFALLQKLEFDPATKNVALQLQRRYGGGLQAAYQNYLATVRDPQTGLIKTHVNLSSARDAARRESSFYDNIILWRTEQLATQLGFDKVSDGQLAGLRQTILARYWDNTQGHFIDDVAPGHQHSYSSDWLIALPIGFLQPQNPDDLAKLQRISAYIDQQHLTNPLPIRYTTSADGMQGNWIPRTFVGSYGNTAIWSYWGNQYITMQIELYQQTGQSIYARHAQSALAAWRAVIVRDQGYPETLNAQGKMLETPFYESIRRNGWVVGFEANAYQWQTVTGKKVL